VFELFYLLLLFGCCLYLMVFLHLRLCLIGLYGPFVLITFDDVCLCLFGVVWCRLFCSLCLFVVHSLWRAFTFVLLIIGVCVCCLYVIMYDGLYLLCLCLTVCVCCLVAVVCY
jgi:hypothetical protein